MKQTKYDPEKFPALAREWAMAGLSDTEIAENLKISRESLYKYKRTYKEFKEALEQGKEPADFNVENALYKRAIGYTYDEVSIEYEQDSEKKGKGIVKSKKITTKHVVGDISAQKFWLINRKPDDWATQKKIDLTSGGEKIECQSISLKHMTTEELERRLEAVKKNEETQKNDTEESNK